MKKLIASVLICCILLVFFTACGSQPSQSNSEPAAQPVSEPTAQEEAVNPSASNIKVLTEETYGTTLNELEANGVTVHPSDDAVLKVAYEGEPDGWQIQAVNFSTQNLILSSNLLYDNLVSFNCRTGQLEPNLATEWNWISDRVLEMKLREDVTSINGDPFTARDVVFSFKVGGDCALLDTYYKNVIDYENTKAVDDYTVQIALLNPTANFLLDLAHPAYGMNVEASVEAAGGVDATQKDPISGTGPYKMIEYKKGQYATFERRDDCWGLSPYYKQVQVFFVSDANTRALGLQSGDYNVITTPSLQTVQSLMNNPDFTVWNAGSLMNDFNTLYINSDREPLNIKEIREAIGLAIDYEALIQVACSGYGQVSDSNLPTSMIGYAPGDGSKPSFLGEYNLELAKEKMAEAGYPDGGFEIDCKIKNNDAIWQKCAEIVANCLDQIGIKVNIQVMETAAYFPDIQSGNYDTTIYSMQNPNPSRHLKATDNRNNLSNCGSVWYPEGTLELMDKCYTTLDDNELAGYLKEYQDIVREYVPAVLLFNRTTFYLTDSKIVNVAANTNAIHCYDCFYEADYLG